MKLEPNLDMTLNVYWVIYNLGGGAPISALETVNTKLVVELTSLVLYSLIST